MPLDATDGADARASASEPSAPRAQATIARWVGRPAFWVVLVAVIAAYPVGRSLWGLAHQRPPLPVLGTVPAFHLTDHNGRPFGNTELAGQVWVAGFFFTRCPTICPRIIETMRGLQHRCRHLGQAFRLVSISVDPTHDTPDVLRGYIRERELRTHTWTFLTGDSDAVEQTVVGGFKMTMDDSSSATDPAGILHGTHFVLVDGLGRIRGYYASSDEEALDRLVQDAGQLANRGD